MRILHIEPDIYYRKQVHSVLSTQGHIVIEAENAMQALDRLLDRELPDLVVCNATLPDTSGITLLHNIRGVVGLSCAKLPFIITYSQIGGLEWMQAMRMDVEHFIPKSADPALLYEAVRDMLNTADRTAHSYKGTLSLH